MLFKPRGFPIVRGSRPYILIISFFKKREDICNMSSPIEKIQ